MRPLRFEKAFTAVFSLEMYRKIQKLSDERMMSMAEVLRGIAEEYFERKANVEASDEQKHF